MAMESRLLARGIVVQQVNCAAAAAVVVPEWTEIEMFSSL